MNPKSCADGTSAGLSATLSHETLPRLPYMESVDVILTLTPNTPLCDGYVNVEVVIASLCEGAQDLYQYESAVNISTGEVQILSRARTTPVNDTAKFNVSWQTNCISPGSESSTHAIPAGQLAAQFVQHQIPHNPHANELLVSPPHRSLASVSEPPSVGVDLSHHASTVMLGILLIAGVFTLILKYYLHCVKVGRV
jgi:hypothetical protein